MKAVIYRRVSTSMQVEDGVSLDTQKERLESYASSQGWNIVHDYCDEGYSAKDTNRPEFQRMMNDMKTRAFDIILVYRLDRFTRSVRDLSNILEVMDTYDVKFKSSTEAFDTTTATGRMFITLVATLAQWERETIGERVYDNMLKRAEQGLRNGGRRPMGYNSLDGKLIPIDDEVKIVQYVFNEFKIKGKMGIAKELNAQGHTTPKGNPFDYDSIDYILNNSIYIGKLKWGDVYRDIGQDDFEKIIPIELWEATRHFSDVRKKVAARTQNFFPFSGILKCSKCGSTYSAKQVKKGTNSSRIYLCNGAYRRGICDVPQIPEWVLEQEFIKALDVKLNKVDLNTNEASNDLSPSELQKQLKHLQQKKARIKELYIEGDITKNEYTKKNNDIFDKEKETYSKLQRVDTRITTKDANQILRDITSEWTSLDNEIKKSALISLIERIDVSVIKRGRQGRYNPIPPVIKIMNIELNT